MNQEATDSLIRERFPKTSIPSQVLDLLKPAFESNKRIAVACSGGLDSVFLLRWILATFPQNERNVVILHFNHGTRAGESDSDAHFVEALGDKLGIETIIGTYPCSAKPRNLDEASLRKARFGFFAEQFTSHSISLCLTAHHKEDQVESLLMRLSRASSLDGLIAPKCIQSFRNGLIFARPLLHFSKSSMRETLENIKQAWQEDQSNQDTSYYRNFIRHELLPVWKKRDPEKLIDNIARSISLLEEDADLLNKLAAEAVQSLDLHHMIFPMKAIQQHPLPIQRRSIWNWLNTHKLSESVSHQQIDRICRLRHLDRLSINQDWQIAATPKGELELVQSTKSINPFTSLHFTLGAGGNLIFPEGKKLRAEQIEVSSDLYKQISSGKDDPFTQVHIDFSALKGGKTLEVKFWKEGMRYSPLGLNHNKKIKSCFIDRKIDSSLRKRLPILSNTEGEILWIPGLLPSETGRVTAHSKSVLRLTYQ